MDKQKFLTAPMIVKSLDDGGGFEGYASVFGVQDSDGDVIVKGAFDKTLARHAEKGTKPKMLWMHDMRQLIGSWDEIREDDNGLWVKGHFILEVEKGREAYALMKAGELDSMSVGFNIENATRGQSIGGMVIDEVDLWEISMVTWGANPEAKITNVKHFDRLLRDACGLSRKEAKALLAEGYRAAFDLRDAESDDLLQSVKNLKAKMEELTHG